MRHPLRHLRGGAISALRAQGLEVDVLGEKLRSKDIEVALSPFFAYDIELLIFLSYG